MAQIETYTTRYRGKEIVVRYTFNEPLPATLERGTGVPIEPPEPPSIEVDSFFADGIPAEEAFDDWSDKDEELLENEILRTRGNTWVEGGRYG